MQTKVTTTNSRRLEGTPAPLVKHLLAALVRAHVLVQTASLDQEPTLTALVRGPAEMRAEPHASFPRVSDFES